MSETVNGQKTICVYCSSSDALEPVFYDEAQALGSALAGQGHHLIYGGGDVGLMGTLARAVHAGGGMVTGVIPEALMAQCYEEADEIVVTADLRERKATMETQADAFIGLPGGFGTLEEVMEILTLKQLRFHDKPIVLVNTAGFYERLIDLFEHIYEKQFARAEYRGLYYIAEQAVEALAYIENYEAGDLPEKWF